MKKLILRKHRSLQNPPRNNVVSLYALSLFFLLFSHNHLLIAQESNLTPNTGTNTNWIRPTFANVDATTISGSWTNLPNVRDNDVNNYAFVENSGSVTAIAVRTASGTLAVKDGNTYGATDAVSGYQVGFNIERDLGFTGVATGTWIGFSATITTYLGGVATGESYNTTDYNSTLLGTFKKPFDEARLALSGTGSGAGVFGNMTVQMRVKNAFLRRYNRTFSCNQPSPLVGPNLSISEQSVILPLLNSWSNPNNLIDNSSATHATFATISSFPVPISGGSIGIKDDRVDYPIGTFVGMKVKSAGFGVSLIGNVTVKTRLNGVDQDVMTGTSLITGQIVGSNGETTMGFVATKPFDEVVYSEYNVDLATANITEVYYPVIMSFCDATPFPSACNVPTTVKQGDGTNTNYPVFATGKSGGVACLNCVVQDVDFILDGVADNKAVVSTLAGFLSENYIAVKSKQSTLYPAGTYAGFEIEDVIGISAAVGNNHSITFYNSTTGQSETIQDGGALLSGSFFTSSGKQVIGFKSSIAFDEVRISSSQLAGGGLATTNVYRFIVEKFCSGPDITACNTNVRLKSPEHPVFVDARNTGVQVVAGLRTDLRNTQNVIDNDDLNWAEMEFLASGGATASLAIANGANSYPANTFAGFDISNNVLVGANALTGITITTLDANGGTIQTIDASNGLVSLNSSIVSGTGRQIVGFLATSAFYGVKITVNQTASLSLGTIRIYSAIVKKFCTGTELVCNTMTNITNPGHPVYVNGRNTGINAVGCAGCNLNNSENVIDAGTTLPAELIMVGGAGTSATFSVANALDTYPAGTFAGFDIESTTLFSADALASSTVTLWNNGTAVQTGTGNALIVGATSSLLTGGASRQIVGIVGNVPFDEVQISFNQLLGTNLGTIKIYRAVIQKGCASTIACYNTYYLNAPAFPAVIDGGRTGITGGACGACFVRDAWNVVSPSTSDFARIGNTSNVVTQGSIAVVDQVNTYPVGTYAGFTIKKNAFLVSGDLFPYITITTYLDGVQKESKTGGALLDLTVLFQFFGTPTDFYNVGFVASQPFDEVRISVGSLVGALAQFVDVYGAFVDTRSSSGGSLVCNFTLNPDFNVTTKNVPVSGNVSTNDKVPAGTTYGTPVPAAANPSGATISMNPDGTYSFTATQPGTFTYTVPVCAPGQTSACPTSPLIITVLDPSVTTNPPVANPDYVTTTQNTPVTINVKANDGPGNPGGTLGNPSVVGQPSNGSATVSGSNILYTPATGFVGDDTFSYQVCETPSGLCKTTTVTVHVTPTGSSTVSVVDDYNKTSINTPVSGNVLTNDKGNSLTVSNPGTITNASGSLVLNANGSYTFTPATGVTGPTNFTYTACDNSTPSVCGTATLYIVVTPATSATTVLNPDFNVTTKNVPVSGNVSTNDKVPAGTTYGTPVPAAANPSGATISMNPDGTYSFTATQPGTFTYTVPVCAPGQTSACPTSPLIITVLDPSVTTNPPVANPDYVTTTQNTPVTINVKANDGPGNPGGTLGNPSVVGQPSNGTATVSGSNILYTPATGFVGDDTFSYQVCETPSGLCKTATVTVHVTPTGSSTVSVVDDYNKTSINTPVSGNVLTNDKGNSLTVSNPGTITNASGSLVLNADGSYTFTPATGVTGPTNFTYTACDNSTPSVCGTATLYIVVTKVPDLTPILYVNPTTLTGSSPITVVVNVFELVGVPTNGTITLRITKDPSLNLNFTSGATNIAGHPVQNSAWTFDNTDDSFYIFTTNQTIQGGSLLPLGMTGTLSPEVSSGSLTITALVSGGGEVKLSNNSDSESVDYFQQ